MAGNEEEEEDGAHKKKSHRNRCLQAGTILCGLAGDVRCRWGGVATRPSVNDPSTRFHPWGYVPRWDPAAAARVEADALDARAEGAGRRHRPQQAVWQPWPPPPPPPLLPALLPWGGRLVVVLDGEQHACWGMTNELKSLQKQRRRSLLVLGVCVVRAVGSESQNQQAGYMQCHAKK